MFAIKNFEKFQHYKERKPPWVKLYRDLWRDRDFFRLPEKSKLLFLGLTTIASVTGNEIPDDPEWLALELGLSPKNIDLNPLISVGFLVPVQDASKMLAGCKQVALVETETETETEERQIVPSVLVQAEGSDAQAPEAETSPSKPEALKPEDLVEAWNEHLTPAGLSRVAELSPSRRKKATLRLHEHPKNEFWESVFRQIRGSPFLRGLKPGTNGHDKWRASFDWLIDNDVNAVKVYEGRYDNG